MTKTRTSTSDKWNVEYKNQGIPSSFRNQPSGSVEEFISFLAKRNVGSGSALDIGCGTGRNSIYLAQSGFTVTSMDFVKPLVDALGELAANEHLEIAAKCHDVGNPWPIEDGSIDIAVDAFCFKHQIPAESVRLYISEIARVLRKGGYFMLSLAGKGDGYYKQFLNTSPEPARNVIIDPANNIASVLYDKEDITAFFKAFELVGYDHKARASMMHGETYDRSTHVFFFQKRL